MIVAFITSLVLSLGLLAAARWLPAPWWIDALVALGLSTGVALALLAGLAARRVSPAWWKLLSALLLALLGAAGRVTLLLLQPTAPPPLPVDLPRLTLASWTLSWGCVALLWGTSALAGEVDQGRRGGVLLLCGLSVTLALYDAAPLFAALGIEVSLWTLPALLALAGLAYALELCWRRLTRSAQRRTHR